MNYECVQRRSRMWVWNLTFLLHVVCAFAARAKHVQIGSNPSILGQFKSGSVRLKHLTYDAKTKQVFVGGVNQLYQFDADLRLVASVTTGPQQDSPHCHSNGCSDDIVDTTMTDNVNKVLIVDNEADVLIACGSILQGACTKYRYQNISAPGEFIPQAIAANDESSSTFAFIGPQTFSERTNVLYVGTTFTSQGDYRHYVPAISSRNLDDLKFTVESFDQQSTLSIDVKSRDHFFVKYVYGFNSSDHAYFVIVQKKSPLPGDEELGYVTRLARVCINDGNFGSYSEVNLQCGESDEYPDGYTLVQDAKLVPAGDDLAMSYGIKSGDPVLIGVFSPPKGIGAEPINQSAMCVFSLSNIETRFKENIHMCFNDSMTSRGMEHISGPIQEGKCHPLGSIGNIVNFCDPGLGLKISGRVPIVSPFAVEFRNSLLTSVAAATTETHTLAFVGTSEGKLNKVLIESESKAYQFEEISVDPGNALLPDMTLDASKSHLYALSTNKVFKIRVEHCTSYTNCSSCLEARDPYCGWCSLEKRCTVRGACQKATTGSPRWLAFGAGQQCIDFEQIAPDRISINDNALVHLTIRTLPELPTGAKYKCVFGGADPIDATVTASGLTCVTPAVATRPKIPPSPRYIGPLENSTVVDHVNVPLSVRSSETNKDFVSRSFAFFDCSRHTSCSSCVRSQWSCNWCVYENRCTSNVSACQRSVVSGENNPTRLLNHGVGFCPRLRPPAEQEGILVPSGVPKELVLEAENLPSPQPGQSGFQCVVQVEGAKMAVPARVEAGRFVVCDRTTFTYESPVGEYEAYVTVVWNRDHYVGTLLVTLYKCDALGSHREHPDCSLCLTRQSKYRCAWCGSVCAYSEMCQLTPATECPRPRIDVIKPLSGPVEGGTLVTIEGSNLGLKEDDIRGRIKIGDIPCTLVDYQVSVRIVCRTGPAKGEMDASVSVGNAAGFTESTVRFSYRDVQLDRVNPLFGPQSGGTQLTITGQYLNIGTNISASLDNYPCMVNMNQSTSTRLVCTTSRSEGERKVSRLTVMIDNVTKVLSNRPFSYIKDPTILEIKPLKSFATGGRMISVHGTNLDCIEQPEMAVYLGDEMVLVNKTLCRVLTQSQMECPSPPVDFSALLEQHPDELYAMRKLSTKRRRALRPRRSLEVVRKHREVPPALSLRLGFVMDNVESVRDLKKHFPNIRSHVQYVEDPIFTPFPGPTKVKIYKGDTLVIEGENLNLACDETDVNVTIGMRSCNVTSLAATQLVCSPPDVQPPGTDENGMRTDLRLPLVVVRVGQNLRYPIGYLQYEMLKPYAFPPEAIAGIAGGAALLLLLSLAILLVYRRKSSQAEREYKRIQIQMDTLESNVRSECKQAFAQICTLSPKFDGSQEKLAFAELQTDMTDLTADLQSLGIPTLDHKSYVMKVFFPGVGDHPILNDPKRRHGGPKTNYDAAMVQFEQLINNRHFLLVFIETLEAQKTFNIRDKVNVASLLMVILMGNMEYATSILRALLTRLTDKAAASRHPQLMLRRTESMVEKMLANWMALCMSSYLKEKAGPSIFLLFKAIKHQVEKGPVDAVTHDARYSLSEERLLREQIDHSVVTIHLVQEDHYEKIPYHTYQPISEEIEEKIQCKVLDCDTISQVKLKILDALYRNTPFSLRPTIYEVDLEYRPSRTSPVILSDEDATSIVVGGWRCINTLAHYGIRDMAIMAVVPRRATYTNTLPNGQCRHNMYRTCMGIYTLNNSTHHHHTLQTNHSHHLHHHHHHMNGGLDANSSQMPSFHLVRPPLDEHCHKGCSNTAERTPKAIPEIFLTRLLSTKGTIEKFVSDFFRTILSADESLPPAVKWLFDLLDDGARKHNITDPEVLHAWKSNSLPLRFWVNFIKNPDFVFDINKTPTVDACLSVIAQTFMDACSTSEHRLTKDSPSNKLLFAKDIPRFREMVGRFYTDVANLPPVPEQEMNSWMQQLSVSHLGEFDTTSALKELYIYVDKYREQIFENLETDIYCRKMHLTHKLENVACTMEGEETSTC